MQHFNKLTPQNPSPLRLRRLKIKYEKLKSRIERTMKSGKFYHYSQRKQQSLLERLQRYYQRLAGWSKLATGTALLGTGLLATTSVQAQTFTQATGLASPFINYQAPFGLTPVGGRAKPNFVDLDRDGDLDAFIGRVDGMISYFENTSPNSSIPAFGIPNNGTSLGLTDVGDSATPTFVDIDKDGDLDIFVGEFTDNINYFENTSTDSSIPAFTLISTSGAFGLSDVSIYSVPTFADIDGDGDMDAFVGENPGNIRYYENTSTDSSIPAFILRVSSNPFGLENVDNGAAPTFVDIDRDGDLDAFVGEFYGNMNYYENTSTDSSIPAFDLSSSSEPFGLKDVGERSIISFVDIDGDGDLDAFIGDSEGDIHYFENTSTDSSIPAFISLGFFSTYSSPSFVDLDGDGDLDAFVGALDGNISYLENVSTDSSIPDFMLKSTSNAFGLTDVGDRAHPTFADLDGDGDLDAFVGELDGNINYFENTSTDSSIPAFSLSTSSAPFGLANLGTRSTPTFADLDGDGDLDAFIGEQYGNINYFENTSTDSSIPAFTLISTSNAFGLSDVSTSVAPTFADIDNDGDLDAFIGELFGRIYYFENVSMNSSVPAFSLSTSTAPFGLPDVGAYSKPVLLDLDGDNLFEAVIGESDGSFNYFESNIILPVELTTFSAKAQNDHVFLHWQTASETENKGFHIERSSTGKNWESIGFVNGQGTTVEMNDYSFRDKHPFSGINYYRLRQVDFDGSQHYSDIVQVHLKKASLQISPNPVSDVLQVQNGEGRAIVYDLLGRVVKMALITDVQTTLPVQDLPQGQYVLSITRADGTVVSERFTK